MENRTYIIGRHGHIRLQDKTISGKHAELVILNNTLYLTDLDSTNGTFLMEQGERTRFTEGYINLDQVLAFGDQVCSVRELIAHTQNT